MEDWEPAAKVQKNDAGEFRAFIGDQWIPVAKAQKNDAGQYRVMRIAEAPKTDTKSFWPENLSVRETNPLMTAGADILTGLTSSLRGGANLVSPGLGNRIWPAAEGSETSIPRMVGAMADPVANAIGLGIGKVLPYQKLAGEGFLQGAKNLAKNVGSGALAGGTIGALSDTGDAETGALVGGVANAVIPPAMNAIGRSAGLIVDVLTGRHPTVKAADILRQAAGSDLPAIRTALSRSNPDVTAAQAAYGINNNTWNALSELAARNDKESYFSRLGDKQKQDMIDAVSKIAGGANQTAARQATEASKSALNAITTPMRQTELGAANTAGTTGVFLQNQANSLSDLAAQKVGDVRRISNAQQIADDLANRGQVRLSTTTPGNPPAIGLPRISGKYSYANDLSNLAERVAKGSADDSLILGEGARFAQSQLDSLAAHGLRPIDTTSIVSNLSAKLNNPSIAGNSVAEGVLSKVANDIKTWTDKAGGIIDAEALYAIRKNAVNSEVDRLMGAADPKVKAQYASKLLGTVKPYIDEAIIKAGGTGWKDYLKTFESGMNVINQQKMGAKALDLLQRSPAKFESLAAGNEPKMVEKIFGTEFDLAKAMGSKVVPINEVAANLARDRLIKEGAAKGEGALAGILSEHVSKFKLPNWINREVALTNRALSVLEGDVNKKTMEVVYKAMRDGKSANALLDEIPSKDKIAVINALVKGQNAGVLNAPVISGILSQQ